jgi:hypothetical protein
MPTAIARPPFLDYVDPTQASVFDSSTHQAVRAVARWLGLDTPQGQALSAAMPTPLVSIYKNAAERAVGTTAFQDSARALGSTIGTAADWLAERYPRIAAHMRVDPELAPAASNFHASVATPYGRVTEPLSMSFSPKGSTLAEASEARARELFGHEATHVAQSLGNHESGALYNAAEKSVGYFDNPFEVTARLRGDASEEGLASVPDAWRRMNRNGQIGDALPPGAPLATVPRLLRATVNENPFSGSSDAIRDILMRRQADSPPSLRALAKSAID